MAITKDKKAEIVKKLEDAFKNAITTVFVGFKGISVGAETTMRRTLREGGIRYTVARKTLIARALKGVGHDELSLPGEVAVAYTKEGDAVAPARLIHEFGEKWGGRLSILGGVFEGKLMSAERMNEIATIPAMEVLRAMFAQIVNSPRQRCAVVLSEVAKKKN